MDKIFKKSDIKYRCLNFTSSEIKKYGRFSTYKLSV